MIYQKGLGSLVLGLLFLVAFSIVKLSLSLGLTKDTILSSDWPWILGMLISGLILVPVGCRLNRRPLLDLLDFDRILDDVFFCEHKFCFVGIEYCGIVFLLIGIGLFIKKFLALLS